MRKIIAVLVVFALVAGAAFAETSISGTVSTRAYLLTGTIADEWQPRSQGEVETVYIQLSGENDEGTFGGLIRMRGNDGAGDFHRAYAYWRPIPQLEVFLGQDPDGKFAFYNAWSHFQGQEGYHHQHNWGDWRKAMSFTNWDTFGLALTVKPIPGLEVNLVIPTGSYSEDSTTAVELRDIYGGGLQLSVSFAIPDIGTVYFGLKGTENIFLDEPDAFGTIGLAFQLSAVEGLDLMIGGSTIIPGEQSDQAVYLQLMANYAAGDFGVRSRWRLSLDGQSGYNGNGYLEGTVFAFDIMPYYNLGFLTAYLNIGIINTSGRTDTTLNVSQLIINPFIRMSFGAGSIRIGLLYEDGNLDADDDATLKVPVTFGFSF